MVCRSKEIKKRLAKSKAHRGIAPPARTPAGILFSKTHTWLSIFPSGKLRIGIDDFLVNMIKNPTIYLLKNAGDEIKKGDAILSLEESGKTLTIHSPISGTVISSNQQLCQNPELLKTSLFSEGWAYTIEPKLFSDIKKFMFGEEAQSWIPGEFGRLRDIIAGQPTAEFATMQDGGMPVEGLLSYLSEEEINRVEKEFLQ